MQERAIAGLSGLLIVGALCAPVAASAAEPADGTAPGGLSVARVQIVRSADVGGGAWARSSNAKTTAGNSAYWRIS
jgi:hypothetical protein